MGIGHTFHYAPKLAKGAHCLFLVGLLVSGCGRLNFDPLDAVFAQTSRNDSGALDGGPEDATLSDAETADRNLPDEQPQPLARYRIDEATTGQAPIELIDDAASGFHLGLNYVGGSPFFDQDGSGHRFLRFSGPRGEDTGGARREITGTDLASLHGTRSATLEIKYTVDACTDTDYRIFGVSNGRTTTTAGWLLLRENEGVEFLAVRWASSTANATYRLGPDCPFAEPRTPAVVHWVLETDQPLESDRVRAYVEGERQVVTPFGGLGAPIPFPPQGETVDLIAEEVTPPTLVLGTDITSRTANIRIWYAAIYDIALTDAQIVSQAAALARADDGSP